MDSKKDRLPPVDETLLTELHARAATEDAKKPSLSTTKAIQKLFTAFGLNPRP